MEKKYNTKHYSLDAIIAVGYSVNIKPATAFRIWATKVLKEYSPRRPRMSAGLPRQ